MPGRFLAHFTFLPLVGVVLLTGCSVGPDYHPPDVAQPLSYKEAGNWKKAEPRDDISKGNWYVIFHDPKLNELEAEAQHANQNLRAAVARVSEARSVARQAEADFYPSLDFNAVGERERISPNGGALVAESGGNNTTGSGTSSTGNGGTTGGTSTTGSSTSSSGSSGTGHAYTFTDATVVPFDLSYELDIWGRIRRAFEASSLQAQASLADFENILLTLKADVATNYFALRAIDSQIDVQRRSIKSFQQALDLTNSRFQGGISTELDVDQASATLSAAQSQLAAFQQNRAQLEHAIAVLVGEPPETFSLAFHPLDISPPPIPPGLPSDLLERRPDVAAAERRVAAQNAEIGVAVAAYFPVVRLTGETGFDSGDLGLLFNWESRVWSYGPSVQFPIFEGGRIAANIKQQRATYEENVANYRQQVLTSFQDVEDSLSSLKYLAAQYEAENRAYQAYQRALDLTNARYTTGLVSYFDVIQAEGLALNAEQLTVQLAGNRIGSTVRLIKALGGGWADSEVMRPNHGDHVEAPSAPPTVLGPQSQQTVPPATAPAAGH
jgi:multidrug efflux system outer membrane protein